MWTLLADRRPCSNDAAELCARASRSLLGPRLHARVCLLLLPTYVQLAPGAADSVTDRSIYELENTMRSDSRGHVSVTCIHQINHM